MQPLVRSPFLPKTSETAHPLRIPVGNRPIGESNGFIPHIKTDTPTIAEALWEAQEVFSISRRSKKSMDDAFGTFFKEKIGPSGICVGCDRFTAAT
jgi:hypothetical protein